MNSNQETQDCSTSNLQRKNIRAKFHDYSGGNYFVTVCTKDRLNYFGEIANSEMLLSKIGIELQNQLNNVCNHYTDVEIPLFVIMPNHFHAIIIVGSPLVATDTKLANNLGCLNQLARLTVATSGDPTTATHHGCRLGNVVSAIKSAVTRYAKRNNIPFNWQSRYHDHIIRDNRDATMITEYIKNNVIRWQDDCYCMH